MATKKATPAQLAARKLFAQRAKAGLLKKKPKASRNYAMDAAVERAEAELRLAKKIAARRKTNPVTKFIVFTELSEGKYKQMLVTENKQRAISVADVNQMDGKHSVVEDEVGHLIYDSANRKKYLTNPTKKKKTVSQKISQLTHEGYPQKQAVAVALSEMRKGKVKSNPRSPLKKSKVSAVVLMNNPSAKNVTVQSDSNWKYCVEAKRLIPGGHMFESIAAFNTKSQAEDYKKAILAAHKNVTLRIKTYK
jgi:hypothetical protein